MNRYSSDMALPKTYQSTSFFDSVSPSHSERDDKDMQSNAAHTESSTPTSTTPTSTHGLDYPSHSRHSVSASQDPDDPNASLTVQTLNADGTPKRPMNAFMIFARRRRPQVSAENQSMKTGAISKILSQEWANMPAVEKQFYLDKAKTLKENFNAKYPDYVYRRRPNNSRKRRRPDAQLHGYDHLPGDGLDDPGLDGDGSPIESEENYDYASDIYPSMHAAQSLTSLHSRPISPIDSRSGYSIGSSSAHAGTANFPYPSSSSSPESFRSRSDSRHLYERSTVPNHHHHHQQPPSIPPLPTPSTGPYSFSRGFPATPSSSSPPYSAASGGGVSGQQSPWTQPPTSRPAHDYGSRDPTAAAAAWMADRAKQHAYSSSSSSWSGPGSSVAPSSRSSTSAAESPIATTSQSPDFNFPTLNSPFYPPGTQPPSSGSSTSGPGGGGLYSPSHSTSPSPTATSAYTTDAAVAVAAAGLSGLYDRSTASVTTGFGSTPSLPPLNTSYPSLGADRNSADARLYSAGPVTLPPMSDNRSTAAYGRSHHHHGPPSAGAGDMPPFVTPWSRVKNEG